MMAVGSGANYGTWTRVSDLPSAFQSHKDALRSWRNFFPLRMEKENMEACGI